MHKHHLKQTFVHQIVHVPDHGRTEGVLSLMFRYLTAQMFHVQPQSKPTKCYVMHVIAEHLFFLVGGGGDGKSAQSVSDYLC